MGFRDAASMGQSFQWSRFVSVLRRHLSAGKIFAGIQMRRRELLDIFQRLRLREAKLLRLRLQAKGETKAREDARLRIV